MENIRKYFKVQIMLNNIYEKQSKIVKSISRVHRVRRLATRVRCLCLWYVIKARQRRGWMRQKQHRINKYKNNKTLVYGPENGYAALGAVRVTIILSNLLMIFLIDFLILRY